MNAHQDRHHGQAAASLVEVLQVQRVVFHSAAMGGEEGLRALHERQHRDNPRHDHDGIGAALHARHGVAQQHQPVRCLRPAGQRGAQEVQLRGPASHLVTRRRQMLRGVVRGQLPRDAGRIGGQELGDGTGPEGRHGGSLGRTARAFKMVFPAVKKCRLGG